MAIFIMNKTYIKPKDKTQDEIQQEVDALTHVEFMQRLAGYLALAATYGVSPYYIGGIVTPNGMMYRAFCSRLARINGNVEVAHAFFTDFARRDAEMKKGAALADAVTPKEQTTFWIDAESMMAAVAEVSTTKALLTTYPVSGCVPLRTLTPEELKALEGTEL